MAGDGADRHCGICDRQVVDLSARTALAARWIVATERPCVRYAVRPDGQVRFRPGLVARLMSAVAALFPSTAAADDVPPPPGQVHVCSTAPDTDEIWVGALVGRRGMRIPWPHLRRPRGQAAVHVVFDPDRWDKVAVRCEGTPLPRRADVDDGRARVRMSGGDRPFTVAFTAGDANTDIEVGTSEHHGRDDLFEADGLQSASNVTRVGWPSTNTSSVYDDPSGQLAVNVYDP